MVGGGAAVLAFDLGEIGAGGPDLLVEGAALWVADGIGYGWSWRCDVSIVATVAA